MCIGFVMNLQPSEAKAGYDIRLPPSADPVSLEKRISEEWAPSTRNMTFELGQFKPRTPIFDKFGQAHISPSDSSYFLNQAEYLKGIQIYELIIKEFTSYVG
ncbi:hypothetical protein MKX01_020183 [Papaver californicum]|nr:hypothetical protein MKX01_020183 [Papaver californicum]